MAIDLKNEQLIRLEEVPEHVPSVTGKKIAIATAYRWATKGVRYGKLETALIGGRQVTSVEAVFRFLEELNVKRSEKFGLATRTPTQISRASEAAAKELEAMGA